MKGKASDICTKCKHCEGLDIFGYMYSCKHYNNYPDAAIGKDSEIECDNYEEETNMNKVEGKVGKFCPKCKNCKGTTRESNGVHDWLTEVECEDPHDGMVKTLDADSDICCERFEPKPPCEKCERFDGTYCHSPNGIYVTSYMAMFGDYATGNCPSYEEKKEKEPFNLNMSREAIEELFEKCKGYIDENAELKLKIEKDKNFNTLISELYKQIQDLKIDNARLEKEKAAHLKGIERLKKSQEKLQNQVKNLQTTNEESYKREEKLEDKCHKLEKRLTEERKRFDRLDNEFLMPLARVLYPGEKVCKPYSDILEDVKEIRLEKTMKMSNYENELISLNTINKGLAEDRKKLINYIRSLKIASENYLKEFTYEED